MAADEREASPRPRLTRLGHRKFLVLLAFIPLAVILLHLPSVALLLRKGVSSLEELRSRRHRQLHTGHLISRGKPLFRDGQRQAGVSPPRKVAAATPTPPPGKAGPVEPDVSHNVSHNASGVPPWEVAGAADGAHPNRPDGASGKGLPHVEPNLSESRLISSVDELLTASVVTIQNTVSNQYLAAVWNHTKPDAQAKEKLWHVTYDEEHKAFRFQCHLSTYFSADSDGRLRWDKKSAKSFERWAVRFGKDGAAVFQSVHKKHLNYSPNRRALLTAMAPTPKNTSHFWIRSPAFCSDALSCFALPDRVRDLEVDHHNEARRPYLAPNDTAPRVALISSPKDLTGKTGVDVDNQVRAYWVWAKLHALGLRPLVASHDGEALRLAAKYDLPTDTKFEMHSEFHEPTYAGLFQRAFERSGADMVLLSNSDVLYTTDLLETIRFVHREAARFQEPPYQILIVGQRVNYRLPDGYGFPDGGWERDIWKMSRLGSVFQTNAEDYFVVSRALWERLWEKAAVPPFVLGGVAFDNWFTGKMNNMKDVIVVDGTRTVTCLHQNHDSSIKHSHTKPKSVYNTNLANSHGSWSRGTVTDCAFFTRRHVDGTLSLGERWPRMLYD